MKTILRPSEISLAMIEEGEYGKHLLDTVKHIHDLWLILLLRFHDDTEVMESSYSQQQFEEKRRLVCIYTKTLVSDMFCFEYEVHVLESRRMMKTSEEN